LKGFIDPRNKPFLWVYEKGNPEIRKAKPDTTAFINHYYSFTTPEGEKDTESFENAFAELEDKVAPVFDKIKAQEGLNDEERALFSVFLGFTMTRVPGYRNNVERAIAKLTKGRILSLAEDPERRRSSVERYKRATGDDREISIEDLRDFALSSEYDIVPSPEASLAMIHLGKEFAPLFYRMTWTFLLANDDFKFPTSDNPLIYYRVRPNGQVLFSEAGLALEDVEVLFPISQDLLLLGSWGLWPAGYFPAKNNKIKQATRLIVMAAQKYIFASKRSEGLSRLVQKHRDVSIKFEVHKIKDGKDREYYALFQRLAKKE
jgi:hypothetical protein